MPQAIPAAIAAISAASAAISSAAVGATLAVTGALGVGIGTSATLAYAAAAIAPTLVGLGATVAFNALTAPKVGQTAAGTQVSWQADPSAPVPYLMGRTGTAGTIVVRTVNGEHNKYLHTSTILSGAGPVKSVGGFTANHQAVAFTADGGEGASGFFQNRMWWKARLGAPDGQAQAWTATNSKDTPANHGGTPALIAQGKLSGLAATLQACEYDTKVYATGAPKPMQVVEGVSVYDPRLDSTYPGGSGPQRVGDEATWAYSENPALHGLTWCIGRKANGRPTLGLHAPVSAIDTPAFVEAANVADLHGWKVGGVVYSTDGKRDVLRAILEAGSARPVPLGAKISCVVDAPRVSLATLTGDDVVGEASIAALKPARSAPNTIWPRYRDEAHGWQVVPTDAPVQVAAYLAADGGPRSAEYEWKLVQSADQVATLARYKIENGREFGPITLPCKPGRMGFRPGDCLTVDEPEYGLNAQKCLILTRSVDPATMVVTLTLQSETDGKHAFALGETADPPPPPGVTGKDPFHIDAPPQSDWLALGGTIPGGDGMAVPAIVVHGTPEDPYAARLLVEWRLQGSTTWSTARLLDLAFDTPLTTTLEGLPQATGFVVGLRYVNAKGIDSPRLELGSDDYPVVTGDLDIGVEEGITDGVHLAAATGGNALIDTQFKSISKFWGLTFNEAQGNPGATVRSTLYGRPVAYRQLTGTPPAGKLFGIGGGYSTTDVRTFALPCKPGDKIEGSTYFSCSGVDQVYAEVRFWNKAGVALQPPYALGAVVTDFSALGNADGGIQALPRAGGFKIAPATAAYASFETIARTSGAAAPTLALYAPVLRIAQPGAAELSAFSEGVPDPSADVTGENTANRITGQGDLATAPLTAAQATNANVPVGSNGVVDSGMTRGGAAYGPGYDTFGTGVTRVFSQGAYGNFAQAYLTNGAQGQGGVFDLFQTNPFQDQGVAGLQRYGMPVNPDDRMYASVHAMLGSNGATAVQVFALFWDVLGNAFNSTVVGSGGRATGGFSGLNGDIDGWYDRVGGFFFVPANARFVTLLARVVVPAGCQSDGHAAAARPFITKVSADQTAPPPYQPGPADRSASKTEENVAKRIDQQSDLATAPLTQAQVSNANIGLGENAVVNSDFIRGAYQVQPPIWGGSTGAAIAFGINADFGGGDRHYGARNVAYAHSPNQPPAGSSFEVIACGQDGNRWLPIFPGDRVFAAARLGGVRCQGIVNIHLYDAAWNYLTENEVAVGGFSGPSAGSQGDNLDRIGGFWDITTSNARYAMLRVRARCTGENDPYVFTAEPQLCKVAAGQTAWPPYAPGQQDIFGDQTSSGIAANFNGRGQLAGQNAVDLGLQTYGYLNSPAIYDPSTGRFLDKVMPAEANADVTSGHNARRVEGQGALAILDRLTEAGQVTNPMAAAYAVTFTPQYPLSSPYPGVINIATIYVRVSGVVGNVFILPSTTLNTGYGANVWVFWNFGGHFDYLEGYPVDQLGNANGTYLFIGLQVAQDGNNNYPYNNPKPLGGASGLGVLG